MVEVDIINTGFKTLAMLLIVLALLILVLYVVKRFILLRRGESKNALIRVLSSLHLSPKERIEVIEVSGEKFLLGVTPVNINFLARLNDVNGEKKE